MFLGYKKVSDYPNANEFGKIYNRNYNSNNLNFTSPQERKSKPEKRSKEATRIKRILLTRKYKYDNVFKDLGIRVTGGKRLSNGDLAAFITDINLEKAQETLGEIKEGDQVLEWNGVLLGGKTFEEVERIINASTGEIEIIVKSSDEPVGTKKHEQFEKFKMYDNISKMGNNYRNCKIYFYNKWILDNFSPKDTRPPIPAHGLQAGPKQSTERSIPVTKSSIRQHNEDSSPDNYEQDPSPLHNITNAYSRKCNIHHNDFIKTENRSAYLQVALTYDQLNSVLSIKIISARGLKCREYSNAVILPNPFVKVYLLPGRRGPNRRKTKYVASSIEPEWNQTLDYLIDADDLQGHYLEITVWDYDKYNENICLGQVLLSLAGRNICFIFYINVDKSIVFGTPRWYQLQPSSTIPTQDSNGSTIPEPQMPPRSVQFVNGKNGGISQSQNEFSTLESRYNNEHHRKKQTAKNIVPRMHYDYNPAPQENEGIEILKVTFLEKSILNIDYFDSDLEDYYD